MRIGYFDNNGVTSGMPALIRLAKKYDDAPFFAIDKLSYLDGENNELKIDLLIVNPSLNLVGWENIIKFIDRHHEMQFLFLLTPQSERIFDEFNLGISPNIESCLWYDATERFKRLLEEAKQ